MMKSIEVKVPVEFKEEYFEAEVTCEYRHLVDENYGADRDGNRGERRDYFDSFKIVEANLEPRYKHYQSQDLISVINSADNYDHIMDIIKECAYQDL